MKTRTVILPPLHPNTIAAITGHFRFIDAPGTSGTVKAKDLSATYQARNVTAELVELVCTIRHSKGENTLQEIYQDSVEKLKHVTGIAVAIDDSAFPAQLAFAMDYARNTATPRRRAVFQAWSHLTSKVTAHNHLTGETRTLESPTKADLHSLSESFFGGKITARTLDDDLAEMKLKGFKKRLRGKPRKSGIK